MWLLCLCNEFFCYYWAREFTKVTWLISVLLRDILPKIIKLMLNKKIYIYLIQETSPLQKQKCYTKNRFLTSCGFDSKLFCMHEFWDIFVFPILEAINYKGILWEHGKSCNMFLQSFMIKKSMFRCRCEFHPRSKSVF